MDRVMPFPGTLVLARSHHLRHTPGRALSPAVICSALKAKCVLSDSPIPRTSTCFQGKGSEWGARVVAVSFPVSGQCGVGSVLH